MLPSRSRLERWNPDSLTIASRTIKDGGTAIRHAVTTLTTNITTMPDTKAWSGDAHTAAMAMFGRASARTDALSSYTGAVGQALAHGAGAIGNARAALLRKADDVDATGQLHVTEQWVVLITGAQMTSEQATALEKRAQSEQGVVNVLLLAVGAADDATASKVTGAAQPYGFEVPARTDPTSVLVLGSQPPGDESAKPVEFRRLSSAGHAQGR